MAEHSIPELELEQLHKAYVHYAGTGFMYFLRGLSTMGAQGPIIFNSSMAPFQRAFFEEVAPALEAIRAGRRPPGRRRFWLERTKKSSKDTDIAACIMWLVAFSTRPLLIQICAANRGQAGIVEDRALQLLHYNPWLRERVEVVAGVIRNKAMPKEITARIEATTTGAAAQGPTPDLLVLNELVHVDRWSVMEAHMNNADGVPNGIVIVSTNAGMRGSPAHLWRENAQRQVERWSCHIWSQKAPWLSDADMEDARRRDPVGKEFARLWRGEWVGGSGDAVDEAAIARCFRLPGPHAAPQHGIRYITGLDLGVKRDHAGLALLGVNEQQQVVDIARVQRWVPTVPNDKGVLEVDEAEVRATVEAWWRLYRVEWCGYDPAAGGSFMAQQLRRAGVPMREMVFSAATMTLMAKAFVTALQGGRLAAYEDPDGCIRRDFGKFDIEHKPPSTYRLRAVADGFGHADVGTGIIIALPRALEMCHVPLGLLLPDDDLFVPFEQQPLTEDELASMPEELLDIYEMDEAPVRRGGRRVMAVAPQQEGLDMGIFDF